MTSSAGRRRDNSPAGAWYTSLFALQKVAFRDPLTDHASFSHRSLKGITMAASRTTWQLVGIAVLLAITAAQQVIGHARRAEDAATMPTPGPMLITPPATAPAIAKDFSGMWTGTWDSGVYHDLLVRDVSNLDAVRALYAYEPTQRGDRGAYEVFGKIDGNTLSLTLQKTTKVVYTLANGELHGEYFRPAGFWDSEHHYSITMHKAKID